MQRAGPTGELPLLGAVGYQNSVLAQELAGAPAAADPRQDENIASGAVALALSSAQLQEDAGNHYACLQDFDILRRICSPYNH